LGLGNGPAKALTHDRTKTSETVDALFEKVFEFISWMGPVGIALSEIATD
jgi:hypothetical protein